MDSKAVARYETLRDQTLEHVAAADGVGERLARLLSELEALTALTSLVAAAVVGSLEILERHGAVVEPKTTETGGYN